MSVSSSGTHANAASFRPSISADGRFVAFDSGATNLVAGDTNGVSDVFVHDRQTGATTRASVSSSGAQGNNHSSSPSISADGRFVAFDSFATDLVTGDTNGANDAFVHDRQTGATTRVSVSSSGAQGSSHSVDASISADGRFVAFYSHATNLVVGDTNGVYDIFVHDRQTGATTRVSVSSSGTQGNSESRQSAVSADGRFVVFDSAADNLVDGDTNGVQDVFVHDRQTGATTRVSVSSSGSQGNSVSDYPSISADGRFVAFDSFATDLVTGDTNGVNDAFVHDRQTGATTGVSVSSSGAQGNVFSFLPSISADGRFVAFESYASNLVPGDTNNASDIFVHFLLPVQPPSSFPADHQPSVLAIANFDADALGRPDLAVVNAGSDTVTLLFNNGVQGAEPSFAAPSPQFTFPVGAQPRAVASADIDADGDPDLAVANGVGGTVSILLNNGAGSFTAAPTISAPDSPRGVVLSDFDADGLPDLIVARRDADAIAIHRNTGGGAFGPDQPQPVPPGGRPSGVGSGDLDNDKDVDVVTSITDAGAVAVILNTTPGVGAISFAPIQSFSVGAGSPRPVSIALRDLDGDGFLDVVTANKNDDSVAVLRNLGTSADTWLGLAPAVSVPVGTTPVSIGAGPVFATGQNDLFTANAFTDPMNESSVSLLKNVSTGPGDIAFEPELRIAVPANAAFITGGDVNLDDRLDLALANGFDAAANTDGPRGTTSGVVVVLAGASPSVVLAPCDGDANGDRIVDFLDLNIVLGFYAQTGPALPGDLDANGVVDFIDLNIVLSAFGTMCE